MTGSSKAWLGTFGEIGHPYTHPSAKQCSYAYTHPTEKQCNYSVDTSTFATKAYVDAKIGGAMGVTKTITTTQYQYAYNSNKGTGEWWYNKTYTYDYSFGNIGFVPTYMLFTCQGTGVSCTYYSGDYYLTAYTGLSTMTDTKMYKDNTWSATPSYTDTYGGASYTEHKITLLDTVIRFSFRTVPPTNGRFANLTIPAFTFTAVLYG